MLYSKLEESISSFDISSVSDERRNVLQVLIDFIKSKKDQNENINLNFICTHNSRRSHFSQIWAQIMAVYFGVKNVNSYSGGTEATALFAKVLETFEKQGLVYSKLSTSENPVYQIKMSDNSQPIIGFSKVYEHDFNPKSNFAAIMTCSQADEGCPFVFGCEQRISISYSDPKEFDYSEEQDLKYLETSIEIATEMKYVFSKI